MNCTRCVFWQILSFQRSSKSKFFLKSKTNKNCWGDATGTYIPAALAYGANIGWPQCLLNNSLDSMIIQKLFLQQFWIVKFKTSFQTLYGCYLYIVDFHGISVFMYYRGYVSLIYFCLILYSHVCSPFHYCDVTSYNVSLVIYYLPPFC